MFPVANIVTKLFNFTLRSPLQLQQRFQLSTRALTAGTNSIVTPSPGGSWSLIAFRTNIRNNFPRARETKRIKVHGFLKRMSTPSGRRILMRRILKGRHVLSH